MLSPDDLAQLQTLLDAFKQGSPFMALPDSGRLLDLIHDSMQFIRECSALNVNAAVADRLEDMMLHDLAAVIMYARRARTGLSQ